MNRIDTLFASGKRRLLSVYATAGYPYPDATADVLHALQASGADLLEIGIPFSDPLADGPVIQATSMQALADGMTLNRLFGQLSENRQFIHIPLVMMGYLNPVLQYGMERFCAACEACGIDGVILPDLPVEVFEQQYAALFARHRLHMIFLVSPQTPEARIHRLARAGSGFLYLVSASATTGGSGAFGEEQEAFFRRMAEMRLPLPALAGFGIHDAATFDAACRHHHGAITGSAFLRAIAGATPATLEAQTRSFIQSLLSPAIPASV